MALTSYNGNLYAGGFFSTAGGVNAQRLAKWDGAVWSAVGCGVSGIVYSLGTYNNKLVIGGLFSAAGGIPANAIALYDGAGFYALGSGCGGGTYPYVFSVAEYNGDLLVGGLYTVAGGQTVNGIARWNGTTWSGFNGGFYNGGSNAYGAYGICIYNNLLIATGIFSTAGGISCSNIAYWDLLTGSLNTGNEIPTVYKLYQNFPNPFNPVTNIIYSIPESGNVCIKLYDLSGEETAVILNSFETAGIHDIQFNASSLASGVYIYKISAGEFTDSKKMVLIK